MEFRNFSLTYASPLLRNPGRPLPIPTYCFIHNQARPLIKYRGRYNQGWKDESTLGAKSLFVRVIVRFTVHKWYLRRLILWERKLLRRWVENRWKSIDPTSFPTKNDPRGFNKWTRTRSKDFASKFWFSMNFLRVTCVDLARRRWYESYVYDWPIT